MVSFSSFNLSEPVLRAIAEMGFENASPIQAAAIPVIMAGRDVVGQARTGTGKTAAFGVPAVEAGMDGRTSLVLVPTRELAQQVAAEIDRIGQHAGVRALPLYGGAPLGPQARMLQRGEHQVLVATPGRLRDHIERGTVDLASASLVVLDEVDEMLNVGFLDEVEAILSELPEERQTLLFSATLPDAIARLAKRYLKNPETVRVASEEGSEGVGGGSTEQFAVEVRQHEKLDALIRIFAVERPTGALVFRHTRETVDELVDALRARGFAAEALHGGMAQQVREAVLARLRDGRARVLVATNVAARGLDVDSLSHVVNYDAPRETDAYVHRVGRTGRAGRSGRAFLFVTPGDRGRLRGIERVINGRLPWFEIPTDEEVHAAVAAGLAEWAVEQAGQSAGLERYLAAVDAAVESGASLRDVAAAALRAAAKHEGLAEPQIEVRRGGRKAPTQRRDGPASRAPSTAPRVPIALAVGRDDRVRPGDLVGALANEGGLSGSEVGRIDILPRMSVVEVPADRVEEVMAAMEGATIRGREPRARLADGWTFRDREAPPMHARPREHEHAPRHEPTHAPRHEPAQGEGRGHPRPHPRKFGPRRGPRAF